MARVRRALVALGLLATLGAPAADEKAPPLTRAELAACLADEEALRARNAGLEARKQTLTATLADIHALEARLDATKETLDATDAAAVEAFNSAIDDHARLAARYNEALPAINANIESLNGKRRDLDARCAHRTYDERDMAALRKKETP
jgi:chromosome segregation ATPase